MNNHGFTKSCSKKIEDELKENEAISATRSEGLLRFK